MTELEQFGKAHDSVTTARSRRMLNITRDTGEFLAVLVRATVARRVLEIGTSNGYSTLWLAEAARAIGGTVTTIELSEYKVGLATQNFARSGLASCITLMHDDAGLVLGRAADGAFDLVFLDSEPHGSLIFIGVLWIYKLLYFLALKNSSVFLIVFLGLLYVKWAVVHNEIETPLEVLCSSKLNFQFLEMNFQNERTVSPMSRQRPTSR